MKARLGHIPGYNYCGVRNRTGRKPINKLDAACQKHDASYKSWKDYVGYTESDEILRRTAKGLEGPAARVVQGYFTTKKYLMPYKRLRQSKLPFKQRKRRATGWDTKRFPGDEEKHITDLGIDMDLSGFTMEIDDDEQYHMAKRRFTTNTERISSFKGQKFWHSKFMPLTNRSRARRRYSKWFKKRTPRRGRRIIKRRRTYGRFGKRRRFRRRGGRGRLTRYAIINALMRPHTQILENTRHCALPAGTYKNFFTITNFGSRSDLEAAWADLGEGSVPLVSSSTNKAQRALLRSMSFYGIMRNLNVHPMYVSVYWLLAKRDLTTDAGANPSDMALNHLMGGWEDRMLDTDEANGFTDDTANGRVGCSMRGLTVYNSGRLRQNWKISHGKSGWIEPGATVMIKYRRKRGKMLNYEAHVQDADTRKVTRGLTVVVLFEISMALGHDTTDHATNTTTLDGDFHIDTHVKYVLKALPDNDLPLLAISQGKETAFDVGGEGPTPHAFVADE